jgi:ubiquinone/menaquinone biosynthesis C-methylase UbiE
LRVADPITFIINYRASVAVSEAPGTIRIERAIAARSAALYADFLLPHLRPDMVLLDCGCGQATISIGLAEAVAAGHVIGVDLDEESLTVARRAATSVKRMNLVCVAADGRSLPFSNAAFDAVLCHSMLETLDNPTSVVAELHRVTKPGGVVGAASVDYGGLILGGEQTTAPRRFYDIRQQLWRAAGIVEPNMGRDLRGLFQKAGFARVEAFAKYISYGTPDRVMAFARDRAAECRDRESCDSFVRHGIASAGELAHLATCWEKWGDDAGAFFAFAWCRVLAWR